MKRFECQKDCGKCCTIPEGGKGYLKVKHDDCVRLAKHFNMEFTEFISKYVESTNGFSHIKGSSTCQFLDGTKCTVHQARPTQCRTFPFWRENLSNWKLVSEMCPGIGKGKFYSHDEIMQKVKQSDKIGHLSIAHSGK